MNRHKAYPREPSSPKVLMNTKIESKDILNPPKLDFQLEVERQKRWVIYVLKSDSIGHCYGFLKNTNSTFQKQPFGSVYKRLGFRFLPNNADTSAHVS